VSGATYSGAGVNLELYREGMARLPAHMRRTQCPRVMSQEGGFAALFALDFKGLFNRGYEDPLLVSCTDGVGTKLKVAVETGVHHTVGIDLVAMSVNDALCTGAEPLFFLDYVALAKDDPDLLEQIVRGIADACVECECALVGGETAILPDMYHPGEYDLAGFCVGVVERRRLVDGRQIQPGDVVLGLASSGFHSNGYSLVRKAVFCSRPPGSTRGR
jgi:phosphoribosylformylglycinamidine cyclo-ligase